MSNDAPRFDETMAKLTATQEGRIALGIIAAILPRKGVGPTAILDAEIEEPAALEFERHAGGITVRLVTE